ncbi:MAG: hypothetical protein KJZ87_21555, partial [Thermoguttaceae bacterium]|nr:hypothetical protein [Thermoguttaceae bacterium]
MSRARSILDVVAALLLVHGTAVVARAAGPEDALAAAHDPLAAPSTSGCGECGGEFVCCTPVLCGWTASAGAIILHRSTARRAPLVEDGTTDDELVNVADFDLGFAAGPRVELARRFDSCWEIGLAHFSVDDWSAARELSDPGNLRVPLVSDSPNDYFDTAAAEYESQLYSTELNLKRRWTDQIRLLAGFRWVELHEAIAAEAWSPDLEGSFDARTGNYLYGFQLGADAILWDRGGPLNIDGFLKAGIYGTHTRASLRGQGTYFELEGTATNGRTSFLGEIGLSANYRLTEHWSLFGGYEVL